MNTTHRTIAEATVTNAPHITVSVIVIPATGFYFVTTTVPSGSAITGDAHLTEAAARTAANREYKFQVNRQGKAA